MREGARSIENEQTVSKDPRKVGALADSHSITGEEEGGAVLQLAVRLDAEGFVVTEGAEGVQDNRSFARSNVSIARCVKRVRLPSRTRTPHSTHLSG